MNAITSTQSSNTTVVTSADPGGDAVQAIVDRAAQLTVNTPFCVELIIMDVADDLRIPLELFRFIADTMAKTCKWDAALLRKRMIDARSKAIPAANSQPTSGLGISNPDPAPSPMPLLQVLDAMALAIRRQVVCTAADEVAVTLWTAGTFGFHGASIYPRLMLTSAVKRSGKSTLLATVAAMSSIPLKVDNISAAAMFRTIEAYRPTLLIDEADTFVRQNEEMRGILNSGFEATGSVIRMVANVDGAYEAVRFSTFAPVAMAGIGDQADTVKDRSIIVKLERAANRGAGRRPLRHRQLASMRATMVPHLAAHTASIETAIAAGVAASTMPAGLTDRAQDAWEPLFAVADLAGGTWPARARDAARILAGVADTHGPSERLISNLHGIVAAKRAEVVRHYREWVAAGRKGAMPARLKFVGSNELVVELLQMEGEGWADYGKHGKGLSTDSLARLLKPFGLKSDTQRIRLPSINASGVNPFQATGSSPFKCYDVGLLRAVFRQYL